jgi:hypothetical protein
MDIRGAWLLTHHLPKFRARFTIYCRANVHRDGIRAGFLHGLFHVRDKQNPD